jgi:hypothetical protein
MKDYKLKQRNFNWGWEVYYESIKREPKIRGIKKCRCDERLQTKTKEFTRLPYTNLCFCQSRFRDSMHTNTFFLKIPSKLRFELKSGFSPSLYTLSRLSLLIHDAWTKRLFKNIHILAQSWKLSISFFQPPTLLNSVCFYEEAEDIRYHSGFFRLSKIFFDSHEEAEEGSDRKVETRWVASRNGRNFGERSRESMSRSQQRTL